MKQTAKAGSKHKIQREMSNRKTWSKWKKKRSEEMSYETTEQKTWEETGSENLWKNRVAYVWNDPMPWKYQGTGQGGEGKAVANYIIKL